MPRFVRGRLPGFAGAAVVAAVVGATLGGAAQEAPFRHTLTSAARAAGTASWEVTSAQVTPQARTRWSIRKRTLHGGKQEGVEVVLIDNGRLRITLVPTRGMGVQSVTLGDVRLGWDSPVKELVHPRHVNLTSRGGLGWLEGFTEWMCRCGLESFGAPGPDRFVNNQGNEATMELTLHGKIANIPASEVEVVVDRRPPHRLRVRGVVHERMLFGPKLELATEVSTEPGSSAFRIADVITNRGAQEQEFQVLYHANYGTPLLEAGARVIAPARRVVPINPNAARAVQSWSDYAGPKAGFVEHVYCLYPLADPGGRTLVALRNRAGTRGSSLAYAVRELPYLTIWKNTGAQADGYVTGLEPGTSFPHARSHERRNGRVPRLAPGAAHRVTLDCAIQTTPEEVRRVEERVRAIQGAAPPVLDEQPEPAQ